MALPRPVLALCASLLVATLAACGSGDPERHAAGDEAAGVTIAVTGDEVTVRRTAESQSGGDGGTAGQVYCTDDYARLARARQLPAPSTAWYSATLITWPAAGRETSATLSHALDGRPDLCVAQTTDSTAQAVVYFARDVQAGLERVQAATAREQQAAQASQALRAAAQAAVGSVSGGRFPGEEELVSALEAGGLSVARTAGLDGVDQTGTIYVLSARTTTRRVVMALRDAEGEVTTATQAVEGSPDINPAE